jgi:hypothetical protein
MPPHAPKLEPIFGAINPRPLATRPRSDRAASAPAGQSGRAATTRIERLLYFSVGIAGAVYGVLGAPKALAQLGALVGWWGVTSYCLITIAPVLLGGLAFVASTRALRRIAIGYGGVFTVTVVLFAPMMTTADLPDAASPWTNDIISVVTAAVAIACSIPVGWAVLVVTTIAATLLRFIAAPELGAALAVMDGLYMFLTGAIFVAFMQVSKRAGRQLDDAASRATVSAAELATASARVQERKRVDALAHDHVLSAFLIASREPAAERDTLVELAITALGALEPHTFGEESDVSYTALTAMLRSAVTSLGNGIDFSVVFPAEAVRALPSAEDKPEPIDRLGSDLSWGSSSLPGDVALALIEATSEAVRNSLKHADGLTASSTHAKSSPPHDDARIGAVYRRVAVEFSDESVAVMIADDGVGFDVNRIATDRLGVSNSILWRVSALAGGHAEISSTAGAGTEVGLLWNRPVGMAV